MDLILNGGSAPAAGALGRRHQRLPPHLVRLHYSARDILSHPLLPEAARPAFRAIVQCVEKSYFAGLRVGKAGFDACRAAYMDFVRAEGLT